MNIGDYHEGDIGPLGLTIKEIKFQSDELIVFMDTKDVINWYGLTCDFPDGFGEIHNKVSDWETKINKVFIKKDAYPFKLLLAESVIRILHDKDVIQARDIIERVINRVEKQGKELLKQYYAISSFCFVFLVCILIWASKANKSFIITKYGIPEYEIWMTMLFGGVGAFIFTIIRLKKYKADIDISKFVHVLDGGLRIFYGLIFGLVMAIAIKSNLILGFLNQIPKSIYVSLFLGICAGASELIIPSLIKQIETKSDHE